MIHGYFNNTTMQADTCPMMSPALIECDIFLPFRSSPARIILGIDIVKAKRRGTIVKHACQSAMVALVKGANPMRQSKFIDLTSVFAFICAPSFGNGRCAVLKSNGILMHAYMHEDNIMFSLQLY